MLLRSVAYFTTPLGRDLGIASIESFGTSRRNELLDSVGAKWSSLWRLRETTHEIRTSSISGDFSVFLKHAATTRSVHGQQFAFTGVST